MSSVFCLLAVVSCAMGVCASSDPLERELDYQLFTNGTHSSQPQAQSRRLNPHALSGNEEYEGEPLPKYELVDGAMVAVASQQDEDNDGEQPAPAGRGNVGSIGSRARGEVTPHAPPSYEYLHQPAGQDADDEVEVIYEAADMDANLAAASGSAAEASLEEREEHDEPDGNTDSELDALVLAPSRRARASATSDDDGDREPVRRQGLYLDSGHASISQSVDDLAKPFSSGDRSLQLEDCNRLLASEEGASTSSTA
ncbi:hypothetical protein RI367_004166 [Sorochytrium milnesiophthora]